MHSHPVFRFRRVLPVLLSSLLLGISISARSQDAAPGAGVTPGAPRPHQKHSAFLTRRLAEGLALVRADRLDDARKVLQDGANLAKMHDEPPMLLDFEFGLGNIALRQDRLDEAFSHYSEAEPLAAAESDKKYILSVDLKLAKIYQIRKQIDKAIEYYSRALTVNGAIAPDPDQVAPRKFTIGNTLYDQGNVYVDAMQLDKAFANFTQSLAVFQEINNKVWIAGSLARLGYVSYGQGKLEQAEGYYNQSLAAWQAIGARPQIANSEYYLGIVLRREGKLDQALVTEQTALSSLQALKPDNHDVAESLAVLGNICRDRKEWEQSVGYDTRALNIDLSLNDGAGATQMYKSLADTYTQMKQLDKAKDAIAKAEALARSFPTPPTSTAGR